MYMITIPIDLQMADSDVQEILEARHGGFVGKECFGDGVRPGSPTKGSRYGPGLEVG